MSVDLEKIYDVFYSRIEVDLSKHPELDVNTSDNIVRTYLDMAIYDYEDNLNQTLTVDDTLLIINEDIPNPHIKLLGNLIYKNYVERELNRAVSLASNFNNKNELKVTGLQSKIVALRDMLDRVNRDLGRSFTKNIMKNVSKLS